MDTCKIALSGSDIKFYHQQPTMAKEKVLSITADKAGHINLTPGRRVKNVLDPVDCTDVATKGYVDNLVADHTRTYKKRDTHHFQVSSTPLPVTTSGWTPLLYFPWFHPGFKRFNNGRAVFRVEVIDRPLSIQMYNSTNSTVLGGLTSIDQSGLYSFPIITPTDNSGLEFRMKKHLDGGTDPILYGVILNFES